MLERQLQTLRRQLQADPDNDELHWSYLQSSARVYGSSAYVEALSELRRWNQCSPWFQDLVIAELSKQLGHDYQLLEAKYFESPGQRHRLASYWHRPTGLELRLLPGGEFLMGAEHHHTEQPVHRVRIQPLLVGTTPVTQAAWDEIGGRDARRFRGDERPIEGVSWNDVQSWLARLAGSGLRLPSESEWEYAARAGTQGCWPVGEALLSDYAWCALNSKQRSHIVGQKQPNAFGLYDMLGNVREWCQDSWFETYSQNQPADHRPRLSPGPLKVSRGGSYEDGAEALSLSRRQSAMRDVCMRAHGLRVVRSL